MTQADKEDAGINGRKSAWWMMQRPRTWKDLLDWKLYIIEFEKIMCRRADNDVAGSNRSGKFFFSIIFSLLDFLFGNSQNTHVLERSLISIAASHRVGFQFMWHNICSWSTGESSGEKDQTAARDEHLLCLASAGNDEGCWRREEGRPKATLNKGKYINNKTIRNTLN